MTSKFYPGRRLSYDGGLCTVRYFGSLADTEGSWLGIEWDDPTRGKHHGTHKGGQIFECRSTSSTAASFVRPSRPSDRPKSFMEAIRLKYAPHDNLIYDKPIEISGKLAEEVGFEKVRKQQSDLFDLRIAVVEDLCVSGLTRDGQSIEEAQNEIAVSCPNIIELHIGWSLIESWGEIARICAPLTKLRSLKARCRTPVAR